MRVCTHCGMRGGGSPPAVWPGIGREGMVGAGREGTEGAGLPACGGGGAERLVGIPPGRPKRGEGGLVSTRNKHRIQLNN